MSPTLTGSFSSPGSIGTPMYWSRSEVSSVSSVTWETSPSVVVIDLQYERWCAGAEARARRERDRQLHQAVQEGVPVVELRGFGHLVAGDALEHLADEHLEAGSRDVQAQAPVRPDAEGDVLVRAAIQDHLVRVRELRGITIRRQPADQDPVTGAQVLPAELGVGGDGPAQLLVHREVAQELLRGSRQQTRLLDEPTALVRMCCQVKQGQRGKRCGGVEATADQVPQDRRDGLVVEGPAVAL